jgi:uncharacterized membrane protein
MPAAPFVLQFGIMLLTTAAIHIGPWMTRPDLFFGVTVAPDFRRTVAGRGIAFQFRLGVWSCLILALIVGVALHRPLLSWALYLAGVFATFVSAHRSARRHAVTPARIVELDLAAPAEHLPGGLTAACLPLGVLAGFGAWAAMKDAPSLIPLIVIPAMSCVLLIAIALGILYRSRRIQTTGEAGARERLFRRRILLMILFTEYLLVFPPAFKLFQLPLASIGIWAVAVPIVIIFLVAIIMRGGQGGSRIPGATPGIAVGDRTPDERWKFGMFYFNPGDSALFVEKRLGVGYTLNFGNVWSWVLLGVFIAAPLILRWVMPHA